MKAPANRFLVDPASLEHDEIRLGPAETHHAVVRRQRAGDEVLLVDGNGQSARAVVSECTRQHIVVRVRERLPPGLGESPLALTLALATLKSDRLEWAIEKAVELGVRRVRPFFSRYSLGEPSPARLARWRQIAVSAIKQCGRSVAPQLDEPIFFEQLMASLDPPALFFWEDLPSEAPAAPPATATAVTVIIGPEGGFAPEEVEIARRAGCHFMTLGPRILRAETAAVVAVALCQQRWGDLGTHR